MRALALALVLALVAACATAPRRTGPGGDTDTARQEIVELSGKILDWRREAGLSPTPAPRVFSLFYDHPAQPVATAGVEVPDTCRDICTLGDYICQAADDICRIAADLPGDEWARRKCATAKASCAEARERCTACVARPPAP
jgi:hypothetical protein